MESLIGVLALLRLFCVPLLSLAAYVLWVRYAWRRRQRRWLVVQVLLLPFAALATWFVAVWSYPVDPLRVDTLERIWLTNGKAVLQPSAAARKHSFMSRAGHFTNNCTDAIRSTYVVLGADGPFDFQAKNLTNGSMNMNLLFGKVPERLSRGLATALTGDGYLLTATHVIRKNMCVVGFTNGKVGVVPARLVESKFFELGSEYAVIKVDGTLNRPVLLSTDPKPVEVFCVGCDSDASCWASLELIMQAGTVKSGQELPFPGGMRYTTDMPVWGGDSGGPVFAPDGTLLGLTTATYWGPRGFRLVYDNYFWAPDARMIDEIVKKDRANGGWVENSL